MTRIGRAVNGLRDDTFAAMLLSPTAAFMLVFLFVPILLALVISTLQINLTFASRDWPFVGLANYVLAFQDGRFAAAVPRTAILATTTVVASAGLALMTALLLNERFHGRSVVRLLILLPWIASPVVTGIMWRWAFDGSYGVINAALYQLGVIPAYVGWFDEPMRALGVVAVAETWRAAPFLTLLLLAALQSVPESQYRAAKIDGAGYWARFRYITLPALRPTVFLAVILQTTWSLQAFDTIWTMTRGGPAQGTTVLNLLAFRESFQSLNFGYGAALAFVLCFIIVAISSLTALGSFRSRRLTTSQTDS